jgi:hypothetical protein
MGRFAEILGRGKASNGEEAQVGGDFDSAAARVNAELPGVATGDGDEASTVRALDESGKLTIREEWAKAAAEYCFYPAAKLIHPAYALADEEAEKIAPQMQEFLQVVADKYAPAALGRLSSKYPEFFDLTAALGVLYWQKWRYVSHLRRVEAEQAAARAAADRKPDAGGFAMAPESPLPTPKAGERDENGVLVI